MEKPPKMKSNIKKSLFKFVTFQNPPFSPTRDSNNRSPSSELFIKINTAKSHARRGSFSGPIVPLVPMEARLGRRFKNGAASLDTPQEPTSPKVSCMGQIKNKHKIIKKKKKKKSEERARVDKPSSGSSRSEEKKPKSRIFRRIFSGARAERKSGSSGVPTEDRREGGETERVSDERAPSLGQMRRFASSRNALANFDWAAQVAPVDAAEQRNCYSDDEDRDREEGDDDDDDDDEVKIPFSAPILVGGGGVALKAKKEVNLWKRRTMAPPQPLRLQQPH